MNTQEVNCPSCGTKLEVDATFAVVLNEVVDIPVVETPIPETPAQAVNDVVPTADPVQSDPVAEPEVTPV